jgi:DNA (cytosine-5)-methyltransferase 1
MPRRLSVAEALAIQSLPREYELPTDMTLSKCFKTIGNGVPFLAAVGLAKSITKYLALAADAHPRPMLEAAE